MLLSSIYKADKGLIKVNADVEGDTIKGIQITGDFFMLPEEALSTLELRLIGRSLDKKDVEHAVAEFYLTGVETPLITEEDFVNAILGVKNASQVSKH